MLPSITNRTFRPFYMPSFFENDFFPVISRRNDSMPAVNIREDEKRFTLDLAIPGMDKKDFKIDMNEDILTISSETRSDSEDTRNGYKRKEFNYTSFSRSFQLPENIDKEKIEASYRDGILSITLPKVEVDQNKISRQIKVS